MATNQAGLQHCVSNPILKLALVQKTTDAMNSQLADLIFLYNRKGTIVNCTTLNVEFTKPYYDLYLLLKAYVEKKHPNLQRIVRTFSKH